MSFLSARGSDDPIELFNGAGFDLIDAEPFSAAIELMKSIMDEIEVLLDKEGIYFRMFEK
jgi:oligoendopeptidase F